MKNKFHIVLLVSTQLFLLSNLNASISFDGVELWNHVVTLDKNTWQDQEKSNFKNKVVNSGDFARRVYLDLTGKIPTHEQMEDFLKSKDINKRQKLIEELLNSIGYASHFGSFFGDLMRYKKTINDDFSKYLFRHLYENKPYDKLVYDLFTSEGTIAKNPAVMLYYRDSDTGIFDTLNSSVRAFLGIRLGCAQCHNHRFDKWTQKDFYETASLLHGVGYRRTTYSPTVRIIRNHLSNIIDRKLISENKIDQHMYYVLIPSDGSISYKEKEKLVYPETYRYENAKPGQVVHYRNIFGFGPELDQTLTDRRAIFAKWLTSKENKVFAKAMGNRLWQKFNGVGLMEPIDDWKEGLEIQNINLFNALGEIFIDLDYDLKKLIWVILNSEAYQKNVDPKKMINGENYAAQGATLRRMSGYQVYDSLLTLTHGNLDQHSQVIPEYFEFYDELQKLTVSYMENNMLKKIGQHSKKYGTKASGVIDDEITKDLVYYCNKVIELKEYYGIKDNDHKNEVVRNKNMTDMTDNSMMMSSEQNNIPNNAVTRSVNLRANEFLHNFGSQERSEPDTKTDPEASIQQIMSMLNSSMVQKAVHKNSYLMKELNKRSSSSKKLSYLTYSIYGRAPTKEEMNLSQSILKDFDNNWGTLAKIFINSREFYFIK